MQPTLEAILERCIEDGDCLIWQGAMSHGTRPTARIDGTRKTVGVRRLLLELNGIDPGRNRVFPTCGNQACLNHEHLKPMKHAAMLKLVARQTGYARSVTRNAKIAASKRKRSPLTPEMVAEIRSSPESGRAVARRLGLCQATVQAIRAHDTWRDYANPFFQLAA